MRHLRIWLGTALSIAFIALLLWRVDGREVLSAVQQVNPLWLLPAGVAFAASIWVRVLRWRTILERAIPVSTSETAEVLIIGCAANNILPARTGEVVRAVLLRRRHGGSMMTALGTIVVERVFDGLILALMLAGTLAYLGSNAILRNVALLAGAAFGGVALVLVALALAPSLTRRLIDAVLSVPPRAIGDPLRAIAARFIDGLTLLGGPKTWAVVAVASASTWLLEAACYWAIGVGFGLSLSPVVFLAVCGAANLTVAVPSTSGSIGPYEYLVVVVVTAFGLGITESTATAYAFGVHAFVLIPVTLVGVLLLWRRDLDLGDLARVESVEAPREMKVAP